MCRRDQTGLLLVRKLEAELLWLRSLHASRDPYTLPLNRARMYRKAQLISSESWCK